MSDDESLVARWSRRKRAAAAKTGVRPEPENEGGGVAPDGSAAPVPPNETQPPFDPTSVPPIESIGAGSDVRAFLAAGVPVELTRAALRRAWSVDPAIRDFVGLSENSWDFNAPGGVPGFGTIAAEDIRRLLDLAAEEPRSSEAASPAAAASPTDRAEVPMSGAGHVTGSALRRPGEQARTRNGPNRGGHSGT